MLSVIYAVSIMLSFTNKPTMLRAIMLNVVMLSVVMLSVMAPRQKVCVSSCLIMYFHILAF